MIGSSSVPALEADWTLSDGQRHTFALKVAHRSVRKIGARRSQAFACAEDKLISG